MKCVGCEKTIEEIVKQLPGLESVRSDYTSEMVTVTFDHDLITVEQIQSVLKQQGYPCSPLEIPTTKRTVWLQRTGKVAIGLLLIAAILFIDSRMMSHSAMPQLSGNVGYWLILVTGLLTGFHCIGMCGGFVVGYTAKSAISGANVYRAHFWYGFGKTLSYTVIGGTFGLLGAFIAFTPYMRGVAAILAGFFLIIFGSNMLNLLPGLRKIRLVTPAIINRFVDRQNKREQSPFTIGLLNGLMIACGPLQAMYVMAAGTGSMIEGAKLLFIFGIGTLPVLLGFGMIASFISGNLTSKLLKGSAMIVILLGIVMLNRGLSLTGLGYDLHHFIHSLVPSSISREKLSEIKKAGHQTIRMSVSQKGYQPDSFTLVQGVPVRWIIDGQKITKCNQRIVVPELEIVIDIQPGEQTIEFTPPNEGTIAWSCWMGMIPGSFTVVAKAERPKIAKKYGRDRHAAKLRQQRLMKEHDQ